MTTAAQPSDTVTAPKMVTERRSAATWEWVWVEVVNMARRWVEG